MSAQIGDPTPRLADLEAVLVPLVPALERLQSAQLEQRRVVVAGDLTAMVAINTTIEETSARIALLEQRRQAVQAELEAELGVQGLRAVLTAAAIAPTDRARLGQLLVQVARLVRELREQGRRNSELLAAAIDVASRTRQILERHTGGDNTYDTVKARRMQAAQRASRAGVTTTSFARTSFPRTSITRTTAAQAGQEPGQPGKDAASAAPDGAPGREAS